MPEQFIFYFGPGSEFSHWFKCKFTVGNSDFCCVEQYLMYSKAILFNDEATAIKIRRSSDPQRHHYLGREVKSFDRKTWLLHCTRFAFDANYAKFTQNENLLTLLQNSFGKSLAEASAYDCNWGIGLSASNPGNRDRRNWRGKNRSGEVLEAVRKKISGSMSFSRNAGCLSNK